MIAAQARPASLPPRVPMGLMQALRLTDGRRVLLRPVLPQDAEAQQAFVMGLSPTSRYRRFHIGLHALPETALRQLTEIDHRDHVALVAQAELDEDDEPAWVAEARYVRIDALRAEFALAVADDWQGVGLGRQLIQRLARHAARHGIRELRGSILTDNAPMLALMRRLGAKLRMQPGEAGMTLATVAL